jgi:hypothetical protein
MASEIAKLLLSRRRPRLLQPEEALLLGKTKACVHRCTKASLDPEICRCSNQIEDVTTEMNIKMSVLFLIQ